MLAYMLSMALYESITFCGIVVLYFLILQKNTLKEY